MDKKDLVSFQQEQIASRQAELEQVQKERKAYLESEQYLKDLWEAQENRWAKKAAREGWIYQKKPFISTLQRQQMAEGEKKEKIAFLEEQLKALKGE